MNPSHPSHPASVRDPADTLMPFGKHKGPTLGYIAEEDDGLRYLDWLIGQNDFGTLRYRDLAHDILEVLRQNASRLDSLLEDD